MSITLSTLLAIASVTLAPAAPSEAPQTISYDQSALATSAGTAEVYKKLRMDVWRLCAGGDAEARGISIETCADQRTGEAVDEIGNDGLSEMSGW
ncbi:UrcA family protein [Parvularcula flava]|uniref:UrcA family protein n=1 Tax=Aquisalinus luteolus TaxID=1566827 RepID=A0A8J3ERJ2_9PROT|nr:UrcA family protein [Aquisalinus luteolus]NHK28826.1 UrcA family protein [Aquisalinus luteolus]GGH99633.1 hypothetical protein GCM10011355_26050 [Aquisalinus luteolus]